MWNVAADIGDRIRQLRELLGGGGVPATQQELAQRAGVRASQVSQWERAVQRPSRSRLERWAEREGWPISVFEEGSPSPREVLARGMAVERSRVPPAGQGEGEPERILARFYQLMADAAARGAPFPPELATIVDALYRAARARPPIPGW